LSDPIRPTDLLGARFVPRLFLSLFIANDTLIGSMRRLGLRLWHALLAAVLAALILHTFQIVFPGHRDQTLFSAERNGVELSRLINAL